MSEALDRLIERGREWNRTATPEQKADMARAQRESWVRGMTTPCPHGVLDFEQCGECRK